MSFTYYDANGAHHTVDSSALHSRGAWTAVDTYAPLDWVTINGANFVALIDNHAQTPALSSAWAALF